MERLMFIMELHEGQIEEYEKRHEAVWPELLGDLWNAGWRNYSLFRRGTNVYAYAECHPTVAEALAAMGNSEANRRWAEWFTEVISNLTDAEGNLIQAPEVWHMNEEIAQSAASAN